MGRKKRVGNPWLVKNLSETGLPVPGREGIYLQADRLALACRDSREARLDLLLEVGFAAFRRERRILLFSVRSPALVYAGLKNRFAPEVSRREFEGRALEHFLALEKENLSFAAFAENLKLHAGFDAFNVCLLDAQVFREDRSPPQILAFLEKQIARFPGVVWLLAADGSPEWRRLGSAAPLRLGFQKPRAANRPVPSLYIA